MHIAYNQNNVGNTLKLFSITRVDKMIRDLILYLFISFIYGQIMWIFTASVGSLYSKEMWLKDYLATCQCVMTF